MQVVDKSIPTQGVTAELEFPSREFLLSHLVIPPDLAVVLRGDLSGTKRENLEKQAVKGLKELINYLASKDIGISTLCDPEFKLKLGYLWEINGLYSLLEGLAERVGNHTPGTLLAKVLLNEDGKIYAQDLRRSYFKPSLWSREWPDYADSEQLTQICREIFSFRDFQFREFCTSCFFSVNGPPELPEHAPTVFSGFDLLNGLHRIKNSGQGFQDLFSKGLKEEFYQLREVLQLHPPESRWVRATPDFDDYLLTLKKDPGNEVALAKISKELRAHIEAEPEHFTENSSVANSHEKYFVGDLLRPSKIQSKIQFNFEAFPPDYPLVEVLRNIRDAEPTDKVVRLQELDNFSPIIPPAPIKLSKLSDRKKLEDQFLEAFDDRYLLGGDSWAVLYEFGGRYSPPDKVIYTHSYPDLKLANSEGKIIYENIGQLIINQYRCYEYIENQYHKFCDLNDLPRDSSNYGYYFEPSESIILAQNSCGLISDKKKDHLLETISERRQRAVLHVPFDLRDQDNARENLVSACKQYFGCIPDSLPEISPFYRIRLSSSDDEYENQVSLKTVGDLIRSTYPGLNINTWHNTLAVRLKLPQIHPMLEEKDALAYLNLCADYPSVRTFFFPERIKGESKKVVEIDEAPLMTNISRARSRDILPSIVSLLSEAIRTNLTEPKSDPLSVYVKTYQEGSIVDMHGDLLLAHNFGHLLRICQDLSMIFSTGSETWQSMLQSAIPNLEKSLPMQFRPTSRVDQIILNPVSWILTTPREDALRARKALDEVALQVTGERYTHENKKYIEGLNIARHVGGEIETAKSLLDTLEKGSTRKLIKPDPVLSVSLSPQQVKASLKPTLYQHLFEDLTIPTSTVFLALCAVGELKETRAGLAKFKGLIKASQNSCEGSRPRQEALKIFSDFLNLHTGMKPKVDLSAVGLQRFKDFLFQVSYRENEGNLSKVQSELERCLTSDLDHISKNPMTQQILKSVVPEIIRSINDTLNFRVPKGLHFTPFAYQIDACCGALYQQRKLIVLGPGTGKTNTGILLGLAGDFQKVLWLTKASNRADTVVNIRKSCASTVLDLHAGLFKAGTGELEKLLNDNHFFVASYDTLWRAAQNNPESIERLNKFLAEGLLILDEGHLVDNIKSNRSIGVGALKPKSTAVLTATPVQQKVERLAALLPLTVPSIYPDCAALDRQFKADKSLARALYHQHSTVYSVDDVALPFEDFSKTSPEMQLANNVPRVPKVIIHTKDFNLSAEHSWLYMKLAGDHLNWCRETGHPDGKLRQFARIKKLLVHSESLGASPPLALVDAIKGIALPHMNQGEKVLILGQSLHPLRLLAEDLEMKEHKTAFLSGTQSPLERSKVIREFEEDPNFLCMFGQIQAIGTGYNFRGISHLIIVDKPSTTSELIQALGRHRRILSSNTAKFALESVRIWFVNPQLDTSVSESLTDTPLGKLISNGNLYNHRHQQTLAQLEDYKLLTSRSNLASLESAASVKGLIAQLDEIHSALDKSRASFEALRANGLAEHFYRYGNSTKTTWREELERFVSKNIGLLRKDLKSTRVALLPGPQALEVPLYLSQGIPASNVFCFEADPDPNVQSFCRQEVGRYGARYFSSRIERLLPKFDETFDILSLDSNGYLTQNLFALLLELKFDHRIMILKNMLCGRERDEAAAMVESVTGDRSQLDSLVFSLAGTNIHKEFQIDTPTEILEKVNKISGAAKILAEHYSLAIQGLDAEELQKTIFSITCRSPKIITEQEYSYKSPKGSPFLSRFAVIEKIPEELTKLRVSENLRESCLFLASSISEDVVELPTLSKKSLREMVRLNEYFCGIRSAPIPL